MSEPLFSTLLAASIHEVKNRFGILYNDLDLLLSHLSVDPGEQHRVESIKSEAQFIGSELMRILASYKAMSGSFPVAINQQLAIDVLEEIIARHSYTFKAHQITTELDCDEALNGFFDRSVIAIVIDTLIYNAIKAGAKNLLFSASEDKDYLHLTVEDDGPGFPPSQLDEPLGQSEISTQQKSTGLGLYFAQQLLNSHQEGERRARLSLGSAKQLSGAHVSILIPS